MYILNCNFDLALKCLQVCEKDLNENQHISPQYYQFAVYNNMGLIYEIESEFERAHEFYQKALEIIKDRPSFSDDIINHATCEINKNIALCYQRQQQYKKCQDKYELVF